MAIVFRSVKGSALTHAELDANFTDLNNRVLAQIDSASIINMAKANSLDSAEAVTLITGTVDSNYIQARQTNFDFTATIDSAYVQARQVDLQRDSAFITNIIDSSYVLARAPSQDFLDSTEAIALIDSSYVQARQSNDGVGIDSATALSLIDSAHVTSKTGIGNNNIDFGANRITYANLYDSESLLPAAGTYHGMFAHVHATGDAYFSHGGAWHKLIDMAQLKTTVAAADSFGSFKTLIAGLTDYSG